MFEMADIDKAIVSNSQVLKTKYRINGLTAIKAAVDKLIAADAQRHIKSKLIFIDDTAAMTKLGGTPPVNPTDQRGAKKAVDAIVTSLAPDYVVLLDGPDVIPHIVLDNPNDLDDTVDSDLPYASDVGFSNQASRYLKITRVVGRIPNVPNAKEPDKLIALIETSVKAKPRPADQYHGYFGLTAEVWHDSTALSLDAAFGDHNALDVAPPAAPPSTDGRFARLSHFINCHGSSQRPEFYDQRGTQYPISMTSTQVAKKGVAGTVVAAECCYGAQIYDPSLRGIPDPICIAYLTAGALGFLGSTNVAYGPETWNGQADLLTQFFFENVVAGASLGRSLLQARQRFISTQDMTDPTNVKTLAQFILLGDPSTSHA
jgi:Peptidase family C25